MQLTDGARPIVLTIVSTTDRSPFFLVNGGGWHELSPTVLRDYFGVPRDVIDTARSWADEYTLEPPDEHGCGLWADPQRFADWERRGRDVLELLRSHLPPGGRVEL